MQLLEENTILGAKHQGKGFFKTNIWSFLNAITFNNINYQLQMIDFDYLVNVQYDQIEHLTTFIE